MKKNSKINPFLFFTLSFLFLGFTNVYSQKVHYDSITKQKYVLIEVHKTYERITSEGHESAQMYEYLGNYYFECNNLKKSKLYFDKLFKKYKISQIKPKTISRYKSIKL
jgi:hypothetical protein